MNLPEILLIDKPAGITSFDVIRQLRKKTGIKKFGHAGTLDPMATGLMIIGVESGTKKLTEYIKLNKEYLAEIKLGDMTTTGDITSELLESVSVEGLSKEAVSEKVYGLVGNHTLPVSAYSAIKKDGVPMYKKARAAAKIGELVTDVPVREMRVYEAEFLGLKEIEIEGERKTVVSVRFFVGSGTYIRSLAEELGRRLGYPATLQSLRRTRVGNFDIKDAKQITDL